MLELEIIHRVGRDIENGYYWQHPCPLSNEILSATSPAYTRQEAFEDAMNDLYFQYEGSDRIGTLDEWYEFAHRHSLDEKYGYDSCARNSLHYRKTHAIMTSRQPTPNAPRNQRNKCYNK